MKKYASLIIISTTMFLFGCSETCDSINEEISDIGQEIQKNPETAWDRSEELDALRSKLVDKDCLAP